MAVSISSLNKYYSYLQQQNYDGFSRPWKTTYPQGSGTQVVAENVYNANGYLSQVKNGSAVLKTITSMNERLQVTGISYGNGVTVDNTYLSETGWLDTRRVKKGAQDLYFVDMGHDLLGNVKTRNSQYLSTVGSGSNYTETYFYDSLNRMDKRTISLSANGNALPVDFRETQEYVYDAWGNFSHKHGVGFYKYDASKVHKLLGIYDNAAFSGGQQYNFAYDANGNITSDGKREFTYGSFDKPVFMRTTDGDNSSKMEYGVDRELYRKEDCFYQNYKKTTVTTTYLGAYEKVVRVGGEGNITEHKYNLGEMVITQRSNGSNDTFYLHKDHQGSVTLTTDKNGNVVSEGIYDPWGKRTEIYQSSLLAGLTILPPTDKGYTGHKHIDGMGIIHMGGRIYDPTLGRFLQADPHIQAPLNSQNYNRYSYVLNNPMSYTDPSGYFFKKLWNATVGKVFRALAKVPILNAAVQFGLGIACGPAAPACLAAYSAASTYAVTGSLSAAFTSGLVSAIAPGAGSMGSIATTAIIGGLAAKAQGGKFGHGFWSAGLGAGLGGQIKLGNAYVNVAISAVVGGTISKLTGGKFANGAQTWAFSAAMAQDWDTRTDSEKWADEQFTEMQAGWESGKDLYAAYKVKNPDTGEWELVEDGMQPVYNEDGTVATFRGKIITQHRTGKMALATQLAPGQAELQSCAAYKACLDSFFYSPPPSEMGKPHIPGSSGTFFQRLVGNSWVLSGSNPVSAIANGINYMTHARICMKDETVISQC